ETQREADDPMAGLDEPEGGDGAVAPAAQRDRDGRHERHPLPAAADGSTARDAPRCAGSARERAARVRSTWAAVVDGPSESRTVARQLAGSRPIASRTWDGEALPAAHAAPVEAAIPSRSSRMTSDSASTPGKVTLVVPGA